MGIYARTLPPPPAGMGRGFIWNRCTGATGHEAEGVAGGAAVSCEQELAATPDERLRPFSEHLLNVGVLRHGVPGLKN
jgi:hypothetical protein